jgi:hypothetical protein
LEVLPTFVTKCSNIFRQHFLEVSSKFFQKCSNILKKCWFRQLFFVNISKMLQHFLKCWITFFSIFRLLARFFRNVTIFLRNASFVSYFLSIIWKMFQHS